MCTIGKCKSKLQWDTTSQVIEWLLLKKNQTENNKCWYGCGEAASLSTARGNRKRKLEDSMAFPQRVKHKTGLWPSNPTVRYIPKAIEIRNSNWYCTPIVITALFMVAKRWWKQRICPSADEWMNTMWYIHTYHSAFKRNDIQGLPWLSSG